MLIEFRVSNFKSIRDEQVFSLVSTRDRRNLRKKKEQNIINFDLPGMKGMNYLKGAVLYGANASGKSNIFLAVEFMREMIVNSATELKPETHIKISPFLFDKLMANTPSSFEMTFVVESVRYVYGFSLTSEYVTEEYLYAYPKGYQQKWFERTCKSTNIGVLSNSKKIDYEWFISPYLKGHALLKDKTRENALFLSVAAQFDLKQLRPIYRWFATYLRVVCLSCKGGISSSFTEEEINKSENKKKHILEYMKAADFGINNVNIQIKEADAQVFFDENPELKVMFKERPSVIKTSEVFFSHKVGDQEYLLPMEVESVGTQRFFSLIAPWLDTLKNGYTVFFDELESSLHPVLIKSLLELFFSKENTTNAQIVFTSHNPLLLDEGVFRRDQVWFTEKDSDGVTHLYPLTEYSPRNEEALGKGYLSGRYGALPLIEKPLRLD